jgi:hypothetical protein
VTENGAQKGQLAKLGIAPGTRWRVDGAPVAWAFESAPDAACEAGPDERAEVIIAFVTAADQVAPALARLELAIFPAGAVWVAWPRRAAGHTSTVPDTAVREAALARSLVDTKVAMIDPDWSGLRLVWRVDARGPSPR